MKTPEEIKKGLECCTRLKFPNAYCGDCSYHARPAKNLHECKSPEIIVDALAYIQQLERKREDHKHFERLRKKTFEGIKKALAIDSHCKSYEGAFEVLQLYTDYFEDNNAIAAPEVVIRLHCYVLGPARHYEWKGKTFEEALAKADYDISDWIRALEVE